MRGGQQGREMLLDVRCLSVSFAGCARPVLDRVDVALEAGRLTIVGESGAGKSTLLRVIFGELRGWRGLVRVCGIELGASLGAWGRARRQLGVVLQEPRASLHPGRSIVESVAEPMVILGGSSWVEARRRGEALLEAMGVSPGRFRARPGELSGGECQRAALARAVSRPVGLLLADEATANLDPESGAEVVRLVKGWTEGSGEEGRGEEGRGLGGCKPGLVWVTHRLQEAEILGGKVVVMLGGRVVEIFEGFTGWGEALHPYTRRLVLASGHSLETGGATGGGSAFDDDVSWAGKGELVQCGEGHWVAGGTIRGPAH